MTDLVSAKGSPMLGKRLILAAVLVCLAAMFAVSFVYRLDHPSLVLENGGQNRGGGQAGGFDQAGANMTPEGMARIGELMRQLKDDPDSYDLRMRLAEFFLENSDWKSAAAHLEKALKARPDSVPALMFMGFSRFSLGEYAAAAQYYEEAAGISGDPNARLNLAFIYKNFLGDERRAKELFTGILNQPDAGEELRETARKLMNE